MQHRQSHAHLYKIEQRTGLEHLPIDTVINCRREAETLIARHGHHRSLVALRRRAQIEAARRSASV